MDKYIGRLLDNRYEILEVIGTGGMAVVYKARCHRLNRFVAIKILKDEFSQDSDFRRRFQAESQAVAMLSHPNIVNVYDVSKGDDVDYIVMELIEGLTLKQYMEQKGRLNWRETLHFSIQIAKALEHAHSRGIVHRDIKPQNIMVLKDGSVKVADFGIARFTSSAQNTLTREALGSVHYISPEQAKGSRVDARSDIYSLGVVMYEMLTGQPPYDGETPVSVAIQHINSKPVLPRVLNPDVPLGLEQITMHAMTADLDRRYASATDMLSDLEEFRKNPSMLFDFSGLAASEAVVPVPRPQPPTSAAARAVAQEQHPAKRRVAETELEPRRSSGGKGPVVAGIICIIVALIGIGFFLYNYLLRDLFSTTEDVAVPNFVNMVYSEISAADYPNFTIVEGDWVYDDTVEKGHVISQKPVANKTVKAGSTVTLTISNGPQEKTMPDLINNTLPTAQAILDSYDMDLVIQPTYEENASYTDGQIIRTEPAEGETLSHGQTVVIVICKASDETTSLIPVPALVGQDIDVAKATITALGLEVGSVREVESDLEKGTVIFQSIDQETEVKPGTKINLQVALGPEESTSPSPTAAVSEEPSEKPSETAAATAAPSEEATTAPSAVEPALSSTTVTIPLPNKDGTATMILKLNGEQYGGATTVDCTQGTVTVTIQGTGSNNKLDVYFDDILGYSDEVSFN